MNIKCPSLPPEHEVTILRNWHYHPCPREVEEFRIPETTAACLLEPGHAFPDDVWLELFPKKLHHSLAYESGTVTVAWGIQIVEGLNLAVIIWLLLLIFLFSALMAVLYSVITRDVAGAFTISAWLMGTSTLFTIYVQLRR